jgi:hypothetical protein
MLFLKILCYTRKYMFIYILNNSIMLRGSIDFRFMYLQVGEK